MKKAILIIWMLMMSLSLTSCWMTQEEKLNKIKECDELWFSHYLNDVYDEIYCSDYKDNKVMTCIDKYTDWLDEKYNNPDNVSNLREDDYSKVVITCNEIFWENNLDAKK